VNIDEADDMSHLTFFEMIGRWEFKADEHDYKNVRAAAFLIHDGVWPSNSDAGYVTRRLLRRAIRAGRKIGIPGSFAGNWPRSILTRQRPTRI
jgi:alanyl-tRNA synthetase